MMHYCHNLLRRHLMILYGMLLLFITILLWTSYDLLGTSLWSKKFYTNLIPFKNKDLIDVIVNFRITGNAFLIQNIKECICFVL